MNYRLIFCLICLLAIVGTVSADTLIVYAASAEYQMISSYSSDMSYATARAAAGYSTASPNSDRFLGLSSLSDYSGGYTRMMRGGMAFNTSPLGTSTVTGAILGIRFTGKKNEHGSLSLGITGFTPANPAALAAADYNKFGNMRYSSDIAYADVPTDKHTNFTLNSDGLSAISKTGYTPIMARFKDDIDNTTTEISYGGAAKVSIYSAGPWGASAKPYLEITYTTGGGGAAPVASFTCTKTFLRIPNSVTCTDSSTNTPTSWSWNMGDGSTAKTTQNVTHQYMKRGKWGIMLNATNAQGSNVTPSATNVRVVGYENYY
jgi:PKD repeat protein